MISAHQREKNMTECPLCGKEVLALQRHHKFSQSKRNKELYPDFINDTRNIQYVCADCHVGHRSHKLVHWSELAFCEVMGIIPRSKTGLMLYERLIK